MPVGRRVVVVGGGMTAIDAAVQSKLLGAEEVTICYRRGKEHMNASEFEQDLAASKGVTIRHWLQPKRVVSQFGKVAGIELEYTQMRDGKLVGLGQTVTIPADQVFKAIGQTFVGDTLNGSGPAICHARTAASRSTPKAAPRWQGLGRRRLRRSTRART